MSEAGEKTYLVDGLVHPTGKVGQAPLYVIPQDLCTRCGVCHVICPTNVINFDEAEFPYIRTNGCIDCGLCLKVCPGIEMDMPAVHRKLFQTDYEAGKLEGSYRNAYIGYSKIPGVREGGSAGGVVTHILLGLLRAGEIDGAIVVGTSPDDPTKAIPLIARTEAEIRAASQSKYSVVANTKILREFRSSNERFAFVGLACQIHGLRKLEEINKKFLNREILTIGIACRGTFEREAIRDLLAVRGISPNEVEKIAYRGGPFPGKFQVQLKQNKSIRDLHRFEYKDGAYNTLFRLYVPERCHLCPDYSAEFSDISCTDIFLRDKNGNYLYPKGSSVVLCRSEKGEKVINMLREAGDLALEPLEPSKVEKAYSHLKRERKVIPFLRAERLLRKGKRVSYGLSVKPSWKDRLYDYFYRLTFILGKNPQTRRWAMRFFFSPAGEGLVYLKIIVKQQRYRLKALMRS